MTSFTGYLADARPAALPRALAEQLLQSLARCRSPSPPMVLSRFAIGAVDSGTFDDRHALAVASGTATTRGDARIAVARNAAAPAAPASASAAAGPALSATAPAIAAPAAAPTATAVASQANASVTVPVGAASSTIA